MSNMSYCRFENTLRDLDDCQTALERLFDGDERLSESELRAAQGLIATCRDIMELVGDQNGFDIWSEDGERLDDSALINETLEAANDAVEGD